MHVEFVETQQTALIEQLIQGVGQRVVGLAMAEHALMQLSEEIMEVQAAFFFQWGCAEKPSSSQLLPRPTAPYKYRLCTGACCSNAGMRSAMLAMTCV